MIMYMPEPLEFFVNGKFSRIRHENQYHTQETEHGCSQPAVE